MTSSASVITSPAGAMPAFMTRRASACMRTLAGLFSSGLAGPVHRLPMLLSSLVQGRFGLPVSFAGLLYSSVSGRAPGRFVC